MFSFHKPKIYRSMLGCCICKAKSSSSRFTDSQRYEANFIKCFKVQEGRAGEICNACVLLVKRWKKLPPGSTRNWQHVVDARAGPGTKSMYKIKNQKSKKQMSDDHNTNRKKHKHKHRKRPTASQIHKNNKPPTSPGGYSDTGAVGDEGFSDYTSQAPSPCYSYNSDEDASSQNANRRKRRLSDSKYSSMIDLSYWKKTDTCCGLIFKGRNGAVIIDTRLLHPCRTCKIFPPSKPLTRSQSLLKRQKLECCRSSDSGVSTPAREHSDSSNDMNYSASLTPPPPTLEPVVHTGQLPPAHLVPAYPDQGTLAVDEALFMPPVMPLFFGSSQSAALSSQAYMDTDDDSAAAIEAAAAAVLDLSINLSRRCRFF